MMMVFAYASNFTEMINYWPKILVMLKHNLDDIKVYMGMKLISYIPIDKPWGCMGCILFNC
jgi:hypothetical protein